MTGGPSIEQTVAMQEELAHLGLHELSQRWRQQPDRQVLLFGASEAEEQSIEGFPEEAFHGVAVLNPSCKLLTIGFNVKASIGSTIVIPPNTALVWPAQFQNLSISGAAVGPLESVTVLRLRFPPDKPLSLRFDQYIANVTNTQGPDVALILAEAAQILPANPLRRGIEIQNTGAGNARIGLGVVASAGHGLLLNKEGGSWNGLLGMTLWKGSVSAYAVAATSIGAVEV